MIVFFWLFLQMIYMEVLTYKELVIWFNVCDTP